ncbi:MAG TPA: signal peptidase I [Pseudomonadota bacterium]|nr:signal peptidase I [Pseudomonadota bacterium]
MIPVFVVMYLAVVRLTNTVDLTPLGSPRVMQGIATIVLLGGLAAVPYALFRRTLDWTRHDLLLHREAIQALAESKRWLQQTAPRASETSRTLTVLASAQLQQALLESSPKRVFASLQELDFATRAAVPIGERHIVQEYAQSIAIAIAVVQLLSRFFLDAYRVPSSAMLPALQMGDSVWVFKARYGLRLPFQRQRWLAARLPPRRGDIVAFAESADSPNILLGRVLGVPMDTVELCGSMLRINGAPLARFHLQGTCEFEDYVSSESAGRQEMVSCSAFREQLAGRSYVTVAPPQAGTANAACAPGQTVPPGHVFVIGDNRVTSDPGRLVPWTQLEGLAWMIFWSAGPKTSVRNERVFRRIDHD